MSLNSKQLQKTTKFQDEVFLFKRPEPTTAVSRQLNLDAKIKSPATASMASFQSTASILSPLSSKEPSPFRFPPDHHHQTLERRDSIFCGQGDVSKGILSYLYIILVLFSKFSLQKSVVFFVIKYVINMNTFSIWIIVTRYEVLNVVSGSRKYYPSMIDLNIQ